MLVNNANLVILTDFIDIEYWARPIGAYRIATEVRKNGYTCQVIDCFTSFTDEEIFKILDRTVGDKTLAVGFSSTFFANVEDKVTLLRPASVPFAGPTMNYPYNPEKMKAMFDYIKNINSNVKIVFGGAKAFNLDAPHVDTIMTGLSDLAMVEYLKYLENKNPFFNYESKNNQMIVSGDKYNNAFDFQHSRVQYAPEDNIIPGESLVIEVARGCIFKCNFCSYPLNGKKKNDYIKDAGLLKEEFLRNYHEHGITKYFYSDDTHNDNIEKLKDLANIAQSLPFKLEFACYLRIDLMRAHPEQYSLLRDGGIKGAFFGIESLHHPSLKAIGKGLSPEKVIEELYNFERLMPDVGVSGGFICGLPYETKETIATWTERISRKDFPIDRISLERLGMNRNPHKLNKSAFEREFEKYYTFKENSNIEWDNGYMDWNWAWEFSVNYLKLLKEQKRQRVGGWIHIAMNNTKVTQDYSKRPLADLPVDWRGAKQRLQQQYKSFVLSYPKRLHLIPNSVKI